MPIQAWIEKDKRRIRAVISGSVTIDEILETINGSVLHPDFEPGFNILSDHTAVEEPITVSQMQQMVDHLHSLSSRLSGVHWAVVTIDPTSYGMMRMLSVLAESIPMHVQPFESHQDAETWLALQSEGDLRNG